MKNKRFLWWISSKSGQDLKLKALVGLIASVFVIRDIYFVQKSLRKNNDIKK